MLGLKRLTARGGAAVFAAFALLAGGSALPSAVAAPPADFPVVVDDQCGTENDTITIPAQFRGEDVFDFSVGTVSLESYAGQTIAVDSVNGLRDALVNGSSFSVTNMSGEGAYNFTLPTVTNEACKPVWEGSGIDTVPHVWEGKTVKSMVFENAVGTTFTLDAGAVADADYKLLAVNYVEETPEPDPGDTTVPNPDTDTDEPSAPEEPEAPALGEGVTCEPGSEYATVDWLVVPATYLGKDVDSMVFENAAGASFTLTPNSPLEDGAKLFKVTASDGTVLFDGCPAAVAPEEPEEPEAPALEEGMTCEPGSEYATVTWTEVPATYLGKDVDSMVFENAAGASFTLTPGSALEDGVKLFKVTASDGTVLFDGCPAAVAPEEPEEPGECIPGETGALAPWSEVPATFQGQDVYYMSFISPSGTAFELTPGLALEEGTIVVAIYGTDGQVLWEDCVLPEEPVEPVTDVYVELLDECGTENDVYRVVGSLYEGKEVVKVQMSGDWDLGEWIPYDLAVAETVGGVQIVLEDGSFAVLPFEGEFTDSPCDPVVPVEPEEPAEPVTDVYVELLDECGTENDVYRVVGSLYEGKEVVKVQMSGDWELGEWIPYNHELVEIVGGVQIVLEDGSFAVLPFEGEFTDSPCDPVIGVDPTDDTEDPADPAKPAPEKPYGKDLPLTGSSALALGALSALFMAAGAAGVTVARRKA